MPLQDHVKKSLVSQNFFTLGLFNIFFKVFFIIIYNLIEELFFTKKNS